MDTTTAKRCHFWVGENFATFCLLQSGAIALFTSLYVAPSTHGCTLKERFWEKGTLLSTREIAVRSFYLEALSLLNAQVDPWNAQLFRKYALRKNPEMCFSMMDRSPLRGQTPQMGETVTCLRPVEAYYSGRYGNPHCFFEPGDVGVVGAIDVPAVYHNPENPSDLFACVDFEKAEIPTRGQYSTTRWRCGMYYHHMVNLSEYAAGGNTPEK